MTRLKAPLVVVSMGDPAGIGREVILKAAAVLARKRRALALIVIGDLAAMRDTARRLGESGPPLREWHPGEPPPPVQAGVGVLNLGKLSARALRLGRPGVEGGDAAYRYIAAAAGLTLEGVADAMVTAPINKEWLNRAGHHFPGHSELLAAIAGVTRWRMLFVGARLRIVLATVHIGLAEIVARLTTEGVYETITLLSEHLRGQLGVKQPRIAVLGLNPHAGENGLFGSEEGQVIGPAIGRAQRSGIDAFGPLAPDTAFIRRGGAFAFDGAVAMYHDQGLIALKTLEFDRAVNVTLGLPFIRTSPDHGTAYDIAAQVIASPGSMIAAIEYAAAAARGRVVTAHEDAHARTPLAG